MVLYNSSNDNNTLNMYNCKQYKTLPQVGFNPMTSYAHIQNANTGARLDLIIQL
jgi:hypothetical protein